MVYFQNLPGVYHVIPYLFFEACRVRERTFAAQAVDEIDPQVLPEKVSGKIEEVHLVAHIGIARTSGFSRYLQPPHRLPQLKRALTAYTPAFGEISTGVVIFAVGMRSRLCPPPFPLYYRSIYHVRPS